MSKLGWVIIRSFLGPFLLNFVIWMLLLDMQSLWLYIDDLMGKGLEWEVVMELMFYFSANWVPMALPLSILLASIMTMGKLGENNELTAMKSAGMSLFRILKPLTGLVLLIALFAFYFSNSLWPMANFKLRVLISDIQETKASIIFKDGQFYDDLEGYNIRVGEKTADGKSFKDIMIYDYSNTNKNLGHSTDYRDYKRVISAKTGVINQSKGGRYLLLTLNDGVILQEMSPTEVENTTLPYSRYYFEEATLRFALKSFEFERSSENRYEKDEYLMTLTQIDDRKDSVLATYDRDVNKWFTYYKNGISITRNVSDSTVVKFDTIVPIMNYFDKLSRSDQKINVIDAISKIEGKQQITKNYMKQQEAKRKNLNKLDVKWHQKFTLSFACIMLFFLGASLGAIVKKGGFGVPVLIAVLLFLVYFMITRGGEEMALSETLSPFFGMWLSAIVLSPFALFIFVKANNDSQIFDFDFYKKLFKRKK
jgi:lipopolysaccharide export system permease protein